MKTVNDEFAEQSVVVHPDDCAAPNDQVAPESLVGSNLKYLAMGMLFTPCKGAALPAELSTHGLITKNNNGSHYSEPLRYCQMRLRHFGGQPPKPTCQY